MQFGGRYGFGSVSVRIRCICETALTWSILPKSIRMKGICIYQGSHRNSKIQFHDFSMIIHDQQCNFQDYLINGLQPSLLAASSPR